MKSFLIFLLNVIIFVFVVALSPLIGVLFVLLLIADAGQAFRDFAFPKTCRFCGKMFPRSFGMYSVTVCPMCYKDTRFTKSNR